MHIVIFVDLLYAQEFVINNAWNICVYTQRTFS